MEVSPVLCCGVDKLAVKTLIFVGEKQCGKSSLIAKFLDQ